MRILLFYAVLFWRTEANAQTWPNEPAGSQVLTDWGFTAIPAVGWGTNNSIDIISDPAAPLSPSNVTKMTYPIGFAGGVGPGNIYYPLPVLPPTGVRELYAGYWWKPSNPWQGHSSLGQKIHFFMSEDAGNTGFNQVIGFYGPVDGPWKYDVYFPNTTAVNTQVLPSYGDAIGTRHIFANVNNPDVVLGQWHRIEHYAKLSSTLTSRDGIIRLWVDGVLVCNHTNVNYPQQRIAEFQIAPTWGGAGDVKTETDYFQWDHVRLSLPNSTVLPPLDASAPSVPAGLSAQAASSSQINLSWTASTDNVGVVGYRIFRGGAQIATAVGTSYSDSGLTASTAYSYTVAAYDAAGNASAQSTVASATTPAAAGLPGTVTDLSASASGATGVNLIFTQVNDGTGQPAKYAVRFSSANQLWGAAPDVTQGTCVSPLQGTAVSGSLSCSVLGLAASTDYQFQLVTYRGALNAGAVFGQLSNVAGARTSAAQPAADVQPPAKPRNMRVQ